jgi:hypothetical protein
MAQNASSVWQFQVDMARRTGLYLLELMVLSDLKRTVLDPAARGGEWAPRVRELVPQMDGAVEKLQAVLGAVAYREVLACLDT